MQQIHIPPRLLETLRAKYEIREALGAGGMATVLLAFQRALDRLVAIKILHLKGVADDRSHERFLFEAKVLAEIHHPNVVQVYELGTLDNDVYMVCEYVAGGSLAARIRADGRLPLLTSLDFGVGILEGVAALHEHRIVHRDLKPENVLLGGAGEVKVADLGLAKSPDREFQTTPGLIMGTPDYMAPEQFRGREATPAADLYAYGVILFEMLTGRPPFTGDRESELVKRRLNETPPRLSTVVKVCPPWLDRLLAQLLDKRPENRPAGAREVLALLGKSRGDFQLDVTQPFSLIQVDPEVKSLRRDTCVSGDDVARRDSTRQPVSRTNRTGVISKGTQRPPVPRARTLRGAPWLLGGLVLLAAGAGLRMYGPRAARAADAYQVELTRTRVRFQGGAALPPDLAMELRRGAGPWMRIPPGDGPGEFRIDPGPELLHVPFSLKLRLKGAEYEVPVPWLAEGWSYPDLEGCELKVGQAGSRPWEARFDPGKEAEARVVKAVPSVGGVRFPWSIPSSWSRVRLVSMSGGGMYSSGSQSDPEVDITWTIQTEISFQSPRRQKEWILSELKSLGERMKRAGAVQERQALVDGLYLKAFGLTGDRMGPELARTIQEGLARAFEGKERDLAQKIRGYHWLQSLAIAHSFARGWGARPPLDVLAVLGTFLPIRLEPLGNESIPPDQDLLVLSTVTKPKDAFGQGLTELVGRTFSDNEFFLPEDGSRPPQILMFRDFDRYRPTGQLKVNPAAGSAMDPPELQFALLGLFGHYYAEVQIPTVGEPLDVLLVNPENAISKENPAGPLIYPAVAGSWKNLAVTTAIVHLPLPPRLIKPPFPGKLTCRYGEVPGSRRLDYKPAYVLFARWGSAGR